jgi:flavin reductase (DIM6/NTAB) family NADH-FMN oxidoreductase RutF
MRVAVELPRAYRLLNHGPTTLISAAHAGRVNVMAAAWVMALDFDPPKICAVLASDTYTRELVEASGELVVNLPPRAMLDVTYAVGQVSGRDVDKAARHGLLLAPASRVGAPLVEGCVGWLECKVLPERDIERKYDLFVAEVVAAWADDEVFRAGRWHFPDDARRTIHHVAGGAFFMTGEQVEAKEPG